MQIHFRNLLLAATIIFIASCSKSNTQGKLIPKNASFVVHVNGKSLSTKLPWDELKQNPLFINAGQDSAMPAAMKIILNNPDSAGIDAAGDLMFFTLKDTLGGYAAFEGTIKNEQSFKSFNKQFNGTESEKDGVSFISKTAFCLGFTGTRFVYVFNAPQMMQMDALSKRMQQDSIDIAPLKARDINADCKAIFTLNEDNSLAKNNKFSKLLSESGDVHFWMNSEELLKGAAANPMMALANVDEFYKGSVTTATINFDDGKINIAAKTYVGDNLAKIYKKYSGSKVNEDMMKRMPGKDIVGLMAFNFNPEVIREMLKMTGMDGMANMGLTKIGFTMDDFVKANKGDVLFGVSDLSLKSDSVKYNFSDKEEVSVEEKPVFNFVFATAIGDKDAFNKLINAGKKLGANEFDDTTKLPFAYNSNGTYFTLANNKVNADKFLAGTNTNFDFISKINGQAFGGYLNIQMLLKTFESKAIKDSSTKVIYDASVQLWNNILMKGGDMNSDNAITQTIEINLVDNSTNSLKQLNKYAGKLSEVYRLRQQKEKITASY